MIEALGSSLLLGYLSPVTLFTAAICLLVLRAGASRVFFDIVGTFQASKLIKDAKSAATVFESLYLDALTGVQEAGQELGQIFNEITDAVVPIAREIAEAQIQLEKFVDEGENIEQLVANVKTIGLDFGFAGDQAMQAASKMAQISGVLGQGSLAAGTEIGMRFGLISGMETEAAMQRMINLQQQTKFMTENLEDNMDAEQRANIIRRDSMRVLDELNTIENRSAATMEQITFVMNQFASQAHLANEEISSMAALSAVMVESGEEQGKGGRALRMMYARLGSDIGGARKEMEKYGVSVTDAEGNMRPLSVMLKELEASFFAQSGAEQQATAQIIAGNRHYTRFLKLMTNLDRVRQLELEATMRMFPAMEEINRRRESELFQLEQAEANVRNLSGALGEQLLPAMTEITNKQAVFLETVVAMNEGPLGSMITGMLALSKSASVLLGPIINTIINFKNMSIAFQTHAAITRALAQQQELVNSGFRMGGAISMEMANKFDFQQQAIRELAQEEKILTETIKERADLSDMTIQDLEAEIQALDRRAQATERLKLSMQDSGLLSISTDTSDQKAAAQEAQARRDEIVRRRAEEIRMQAESDREIMQAAKDQAKAFNGITMSLAGTGSALMMFGQSQKAVRAGMVLNTAAMGAQVAVMVKKNAASVVELFQNKVRQFDQKAEAFMNTQLLTQKKQNIILLAKEAHAIGGVNLALRGTMVAATGAATAMKNFLKISGPLLALAAGSVILVEVAEKFGIFGSKAEELEETTVSAVANTEDVIAMLDDEAMSLQRANEQLEEKERLHQSLISSGIELNKVTAEALAQEIANLKAYKQVQEFKELGAQIDEDATQAYFDAINEEKKLLDKFGEGFFLEADASSLFGFTKLANRLNPRAGILGGGLLDGVGFNEQIKKTRDVQENFLEQFPLVAQAIAEGTITNMEELQTYMDDTAISLEQTLGAGRDSAINDINAVTEELENFSNAREELFFGSRSNMTGDLIRQVQQQGVENLITTTEVVMTNIFNGLTIPEMVDIVIEEIEGRGRLNGYNITSS